MMFSGCSKLGSFTVYVIYIDISMCIAKCKIQFFRVLISEITNILYCKVNLLFKNNLTKIKGINLSYFILVIFYFIPNKIHKYILYFINLYSFCNDFLYTIYVKLFIMICHSRYVQ